MKVNAVINSKPQSCQIFGDNLVKAQHSSIAARDRCWVGRVLFDKADDILPVPISILPTVIKHIR